jgi:hypothetical protein
MTVEVYPIDHSAGVEKSGELERKAGEVGSCGNLLSGKGKKTAKAVYEHIACSVPVFYNSIPNKSISPILFSTLACAARPINSKLSGIFPR